MKTPKVLFQMFDPVTGVETIAFILPDDRYQVFGYFLSYHDKEQAVGGLCASILGRDADGKRVVSWAAQQQQDEIEIRIKIGPPWWWVEFYQQVYNGNGSQNDASQQGTSGVVRHDVPVAR